MTWESNLLRQNWKIKFLFPNIPIQGTTETNCSIKFDFMSSTTLSKILQAPLKSERGIKPTTHVLSKLHVTFELRNGRKYILFNFLKFLHCSGWKTMSEISSQHLSSCKKQVPKCFCVHITYSTACQIHTPNTPKKSISGSWRVLYFLFFFFFACAFLCRTVVERRLIVSIHSLLWTPNLNQYGWKVTSKHLIYIRKD